MEREKKCALYSFNNGVKRRVKDVYLGTSAGNILVYSEDQGIDLLADKELAGMLPIIQPNVDLLIYEKEEEE